MAKGKFKKWIKKISKKTWDYLNGKKFYIGTAISVLSWGTEMIAPDLMPPAAFDFFEALGGAIAAGGAVHKVGKIRMHTGTKKETTIGNEVIKFSGSFVKKKKSGNSSTGNNYKIHKDE